MREALSTFLTLKFTGWDMSQSFHRLRRGKSAPISHLPPGCITKVFILKMSAPNWNFKLGEVCAATSGAISAVD